MPFSAQEFEEFLMLNRRRPRDFGKIANALVGHAIMVISAMYLIHTIGSGYRSRQFSHGHPVRIGGRRDALGRCR